MIIGGVASPGRGARVRQGGGLGSPRPARCLGRKDQGLPGDGGTGEYQISGLIHTHIYI